MSSVCAFLKEYLFHLMSMFFSGYRTVRGLQDERIALSPLENIILSCDELQDSTSTVNIVSSEMEGAPEYCIGSLSLLNSSEEEMSVYVRQLPDSAFPSPKLTLPKNRKKGMHAISLILDLDETLVHSTTDSCIHGWAFRVEVQIDDLSCLYFVHKRPHLDYFIRVISNWYNLIIFTASLEQYANPVVSWLDNGEGIFSGRLFRQHCKERNGMFLKDLTIVDPDLSKVCLLDNSVASFILYPDNAIPINSWFSDSTDTALLDMLPFLDALRFTHDVRSILCLRRLKAT